MCARSPQNRSSNSLLCQSHPIFGPHEWDRPFLVGLLVPVAEMGEGFADREYGDSRELASRRLPEKATKLTMTSLNSFSSSSLM